MNFLRRTYERLVDLVTGTEVLEVQFSEEERQALEELVEEVSELSGVKPSTVVRVMFAEALIRKEGLEDAGSIVIPREHN